MLHLISVAAKLVAELVVLAQEDVRRLVTMRECIDLVTQALRASSVGETGQLLRNLLELPGGRDSSLSSMCGYLTEPTCFGAKVVSVFPNNSSNGRQSHQGAVILFESEEGFPVAVVHAGEITNLRTAAASAVATRLLAREDASNLAILGNGVQAMSHVAAMLEVRQIRTIRVWGRSADRAGGFARRLASQFGIDTESSPTVESAVRHADVVCTVTASRDPILRGEWISPGTHLNVVGSSTAQCREIDSALVAQSRMFVDYRPMALAAAGEYLAALAEGRVDGNHILAEIGEILTGAHPGRESAEEITMFKSLGIPPQDLIVAEFVRQRALSLGAGTRVRF